MHEDTWVHMQHWDSYEYPNSLVNTLNNLSQYLNNIHNQESFS